MLERYPDVPGPMAYGMSKVHVLLFASTIRQATVSSAEERQAAFNFFTTRLASDLRPEGFLVFSLSPALVYDGPGESPTPEQEERRGGADGQTSASSCCARRKV